MVLRHDALASFHDTNADRGHLRVDKVLSALRQRYFWPRMHKNIKNSPLTPLPIVVGPFERWHMNFLYMIKTKDGYLYLFLMVDSFTKWVEAFPMKSQEASEVAKIIFRAIIARFGCPRILVSDRSRKFMSTLVLSLCEVFDITRHHASSYHHQTHGLVESANSTLIKSFRAYCVIRTSIIGLRNFLEF